MEQVKLTLPENTRQMIIEFLIDLFKLQVSLLLALLLHQLVDVVTGLVGVVPLLKLQCELQLLLPKLKNLCHLHVIIQLDWEWDVL